MMPAMIPRMPVAWHQLRIPGPPAVLALTREEQHAVTAEARFARRTIQRIERARAASGEPPLALALIDKASPHALFDLMLTDVAPARSGQRPAADPGAVAEVTGRLLWQSAAHFSRFIAEPAVQREFGLGPDTGVTHLALNCDPNTFDRESVQALKRFHLHLIHWHRPELAPLQHPESYGEQTDALLARQCLDPLTFVGTELLYAALSDSALELAGAELIAPDPAAACAGHLPLGALLRLESWERLTDPMFERLVRRLHQQIAHTARALMRAVTGHDEPAPAWRRHRLLAPQQIADNLDALDLGAQARARVLGLTDSLRDLDAESAERLKLGSALARQHCMTLNQPCYSLGLTAFPVAGQRPQAAQQAGPSQTRPILSIQLKLFSGIGGAGLLSLPGIASVRVVRGHGRFSADAWHRRACFQRRFAAYNTAALHGVAGGRGSTWAGQDLRTGPIGRLRDLRAGWTRA
jgi:hypothetical protein